MNLAVLIPFVAMTEASAAETPSSGSRMPSLPENRVRRQLRLGYHAVFTEFRPSVGKLGYEWLWDRIRDAFVTLSLSV
jgi:hypothetical protein